MSTNTQSLNEYTQGLTGSLSMQELVPYAQYEVVGTTTWIGLLGANHISVVSHDFVLCSTVGDRRAPPGARPMGLANHHAVRRRDELDVLRRRCLRRPRQEKGANCLCVCARACIPRVAGGLLWAPVCRFWIV